MKNLVGNMMGLGVILAGTLLLAESAGAIDEHIKLKDESSYGSGSSISEEHYYPGGLPGIGLYVGNPNPTIRNDRALFQFDVESLLLKVKKIKKAEFVFWVDYYDSKEEKVEVEVSRLLYAPDLLTGRVLPDPEAESIGTVEAVQEDAIQNPAGNTNAAEKIIDVTEALKANLTDGVSTITFRLKAPEIEAKAIPGRSNGIIIYNRASEEKERWPMLVVTFED
jgi:hypothetical protein